MVKKQSINRIIIVVSIVFLVVLFGVLFGYKQGSFYKFFLSKNKALTTTEGFYNDKPVFIDYEPVNTYLVENFETILDHIFKQNVTALATINDASNGLLSTFDTKSLPLFIKSIFDNHNFLKLVNFKNEDGSISIESPIESYEELCMQKPNATYPVTNFLSDKFAELIVFIRDALTKVFFNSNPAMFTNYLTGNTNKVKIDELYEHILYNNTFRNYNDIIIFLYKYNGINQEAIGDYIFKDIFIIHYNRICDYPSSKPTQPIPTKADDPTTTTTMPNNWININYRLTNGSISYIKTIIFNAIFFQQYQKERNRSGQLSAPTGQPPFNAATAGTGTSTVASPPAGPISQGAGTTSQPQATTTTTTTTTRAGTPTQGAGTTSQGAGTTSQQQTTTTTRSGTPSQGAGTPTQGAGPPSQGNGTASQQQATTTTRARLPNPETETVEFQREVLNRLSELYNDNSELFPELREAVRKLPLNIRNNICRDYCSVSTTNNAKFCNDVGCSGMSGLSNDALGLMDSLTNDRSLDYSNVNDAYSLLDMDNGTMSRYLSTGMYRNMFNDGNMQSMCIPDSRRIQPKSKFAQTNIIQKDTDGVSNIFAPNIYVLPKRDGSYATYMANDPNDPAYRDFINNLITNYA